MKIFIPPIKCQGIKSKMVPWILENARYPESGRWIEPFMGSGVVGFNARPERAVLADLNPHIIGFYQAVKSGEITPKTVRVFLEHEGQLLRDKGEQHFYYIRERFNREKAPLDFLFLSRAGFNGIIRFNSKGGYNVPFCRKPDRFSKAYVTKIVNQVQSIFELLSRDWDFSHQHFRDTIADAGKDDFIYCDPPYLGRHTDYFNSWSEADERELHDCLLKTKARFVLSTWYGNEYRQNPMIDAYRAEFYVLTKNHFYHVGGKEINRKPMVEALVLNYEPAEVNASELAKQLVLLENRSKYTPRSRATMQ